MDDEGRKQAFVDASLESARIVARARRENLVGNTKAGQYGCIKCGHIAKADEFRHGAGREYGQHPSHRYCPACGVSIDWFGYVDGDRVARQRGARVA